MKGRVREGEGGWWGWKNGYEEGIRGLERKKRTGKEEGYGKERLPLFPKCSAKGKMPTSPLIFICSIFRSLLRPHFQGIQRDKTSLGAPGSIISSKRS